MSGQLSSPARLWRLTGTRQAYCSPAKNSWLSGNTIQATWSAALQELQSKIEEAGIIVVVNSVVGNNTHRKLDVGEFRGFVLVDEYAPLVFVNGADGKAAQMFTLAHEVAHLWFGSSAAFDLRALQPADNDTELASNRAAAEFLVPHGELREVWPSVRQHPDPRIVVTLEKFDPQVRRKIPIPNVCQAFGVRFIDTFGLLRTLGVRLG